MKKNTGIVRNRLSQLQETKKKLQRKKHRFQPISPTKNTQLMSQSASRTTEELLTSTSVHSHTEHTVDIHEIYDQAKQKLLVVTEIQKKITVQSKARLTSFKEKQNQKYDEKISKLASDATNHLVQAEKYLKLINQIEVKNQSQSKLINNMKKSLALEIREVSKSLRNQEKQYFDTIRMYEKNITNDAIKLSEKQKQMMSSGEQMFQEMEEQKNDLENRKIDDLVSSINKLSSIYKQLNNLVIEQGSLIDRIDVNIQSTFQHTQKAVTHLEAADEAARSAFADKVIKVLVVCILVMSVFLGYKYAA